MAMEVDTLIAVAIMMAVFSAVAAVGTSLVLGAGFERLRCGFEVISKQTGFFSDAIHQLENKMETVDNQTQNFEKSIKELDAKVLNVGEQANHFSDTMTNMNERLERVDKQTGFFSNAIHTLEEKIELVGEHEQRVAEKLEDSADTDLISAGKAEALVSHAEDLLLQVSTLAMKMDEKSKKKEKAESLGLQLPENIGFFSVQSDQPDDGHEIRLH